MRLLSVELRVWGLSGQSLRMLDVLPSDDDPGRWPAARELDWQLDLERGVSTAILRRLRKLGLVTDDGRYPRRYARTSRGTTLLDQESRQP